MSNQKKLVSLTERQVKYLKDESEFLGLNFSEFLRRVIDEYIVMKENQNATK